VALTANTAYNLQFIAIDSPLFSSSAFFRITGTLATNDPPPPPPPVDPPPAGPGAIPEPSTYALSGGAIAALAYLRNRKR
jgi:hypothetical protein